MKERYEERYKEKNKEKRIGLMKVNLDLKKHPKNRWEAALKFMKINENDKILDVGCGEGVILNYLVGKSKFIYGIDISSHLIDILKKRIEKGVNLQQMNIENKTPFKDDYFDMIILTDVIEHIADLYISIKELKRILKKNGLIFIDTPNIAKLRNRLKLLFGMFPSTGSEKNNLWDTKNGNLYDGGHLHYFTFSSLQLVMESFGFSLVKKFGYGRFGGIHDIFPEISSGSIGMIFRKSK